MRQCVNACLRSLCFFSPGPVRYGLSECRICPSPRITSVILPVYCPRQTQASLNALCAQVDRQAHAQIAVVTVKSLDGEPIENFATALEDKWKVGKKGTDRGLLLIFATNDRKYRVEVGYGLEGILPDGRVGDIGRQMVPYLRQNDYDGAVTVGGAADRRGDRGGRRRDAQYRAPACVCSRSRRRGRSPWAKWWCWALFCWLVIFFLARFGGSGLLGFLIGMFWVAAEAVAGAAAVEAAAGVVAEAMAADSEDLAGEVPAAVGLRVVGRLTKRAREGELWNETRALGSNRGACGYISGGAAGFRQLCKRKESDGAKAGDGYFLLG